jgi:3-hydroxybutyryl-CoA dehydrogenase
MDLIGIDTAYEILDTMYKQSRNRLHAPSPIIKQMMTAGLLGRKSGRGFYTYAERDSAQVVDDALTPAAGGATEGARPVSKVGVVGSGTMATGIIEVAAKGGYDVTFVARTLDKVEAVQSALAKSLDKQVARGRLDEATRDEVLGRVHGSDVLDDLADVDLVIEAIVEHLATKQALFANLGEICKPGAVLATTTSGRRRGPALLQPRAGDEAGRGGVDHRDGRGRRGHRARRVRAAGQARGLVHRPRRLHRERAAVPVPQRRGQDARGALRHRR